MKKQTHLHLRCHILVNLVQFFKKNHFWVNCFIKTKKLDGGGDKIMHLFIYLFAHNGWWSITQCKLFFFFFFFYISRICKTLLSSSAVRHRESLGYVSFFPLMSLGLNPSCRLLIYCSDMLIVSYANKETIRLLIISLHSSNRTGSSYTVIWNCLLVFLWPSCDFNLFIFYWPSFSLSLCLTPLIFSVWGMKRSSVTLQLIHV